MPRIGHGNEGLMILFPIGAAAIVGVILLGGPKEAIEAINNIVRNVASEAMTVARAWF
jgi:hypothetical protein